MQYAMATRPAIFKWRQTEPVLILSAVRCYLRYSLSLRDVEELLKERGLEVDHTTVWHWVQRYGPEREKLLRRHLKATNKSWRVDETYIRVKGSWCYLYRAIDSAGATITARLKRRVNAKQGFREFQAAQQTIQGYEAMNMMRKGQVRWVSGTDVRRQVHFIHKLFELAAWARASTVSPPNSCAPIQRQSKVATLPGILGA